MLGAVQGASIVYLNSSGVTDLSDGAAWDGGVPPGAGDVAVFDGTIPASLTVADGTAWSGMIRTNIENAVTFTGGPLTLGADGITCFTQNDAYHRTYLPDLVLASAQTWTLTTNKAIFANGSVTGTGPLTLTSPAAYNVVFCGAVEPTGGVTLQGPVCVWGNQSARFLLAPDMAYASQFLFWPDGTGNVAFSDVLESRAVVNNGIFSFGAKDADVMQAAAVSPVVTLSAGDSITGTDAGNSDRSKQQIHVQDTHVVVDGADLTGNSWFYLRNGSWTQLAGDTAFNYAALIGRGAIADYKCKQQRLTLAGGTFTARRMSVGMANSEPYPAEVFVTGGSYVPTLPNDETWTSAIVVGQRTAYGETVWSNEKNQHVPMENAWTSGRFEMRGGTVTASGLFFGNTQQVNNPDNNKAIKDVNTASRFALRGGTLRLGKNGVRTGTFWDGNSDSHYDCDLSGGTFSFYRDVANSQADMRLSDRDGGTSFEAPSGVINTRISGRLFGPGGFRKTGASTLRLVGSNDYTGRTEVVEGSLYTGLNAATPMEAIWEADVFLGLAAGAQITTWPNYSGAGGASKWSFQDAASLFSGRGYSTPTLAATTMNGHAELAFDGTRAIFLTGNANQPISYKRDFTIACVLRVDDGAVGGGSQDWQDATVIMGCTIGALANVGSRYGLALNADGCLGCGMRSVWKEGGATVTTNETLWSTTPVNDGKPHVVMWTWQFNGQHVLQVDGQKWSCTSVTNGCGETMRTRFIIGAGEDAPANTFRINYDN